jgi:hypothetical protein
MALVRVKPTLPDVAIARAVAAHTGRPTEYVAQGLTWGADEHVLSAIAFAWWLYARSGGAQIRRASDHVLLTTLVASALPHGLKKIFDQQRRSVNGTRTSSRDPAFGKAAGCFPVWTRRPYRRLGFGGDTVATSAAKRRLGRWRRVGAYPDRAPRTLDQRRVGRPGRGSADRTFSQVGHWLRPMLMGRR